MRNRIRRSDWRLAKKRGRPSKYTPEALETICKAISDGVPMKYAAALGNISHETLCQWQKKFPEFSEAIQNAVAKGIAARLGIVIEAARTDPRAAQWWLEHVFPEHFARNRVEVKHEGGIEHQFVIPPMLLDQIAQARAEHERKSDA